MIAPTPGSASIRFPWPDEQARLLRLLPSPVPDPSRIRTWYWVLAASAPERLVGAIALHEREGPEQSAPSGRLELALKPAWRETELATELLETALRAADELRLGQLEIDADPASALATQLSARGFSAGEVQALWRVDPAEVWGEHGPTMLRGLQRRAPAQVQPLTAEDLPSVRQLCAHFALLTPDRVQILPAPQGYDPALSFVFKVEKEVRAAVLCRAEGRTVYLEVFARYASVSFSDSSAMVGLMFALLEACVQRGTKELYCVVRPAATPDLINLLKRGHGRCIQQYQLFTRRLTSHEP